MRIHFSDYVWFCFAFLVVIACNNKNAENHVTSAEQQDKTMAEVNHDPEVIPDYDFAVTAADGNLLEVKLGELAFMNASDQEVKELARSLKDDHTASANELVRFTHQKNVVLPVTLTRAAQHQFDELSRKKGDDFDECYVKMMIDNHATDLETFKKEAAHGQDEDLKSYASGKVPALENHIEKSKRVRKSLETNRRNKASGS